MGEIKGIILNGTQYGLEDETTLATANAGLQLAESNANDITALESDVIGVKTNVETALNTANSAKTTAETALATAENAKALVDEKQPQIIGRYTSFRIDSNNPHIFTDEEMLVVFGKTNEELQGVFDYLVLLSISVGSDAPIAQIAHMGYDGTSLYRSPYYTPGVRFYRENGRLGIAINTDTSTNVWLTAIPCELTIR